MVQRKSTTKPRTTTKSKGTPRRTKVSFIGKLWNAIKSSAMMVVIIIFILTLVSYIVIDDLSRNNETINPVGDLKITFESKDKTDSFKNGTALITEKVQVEKDGGFEYKLHLEINSTDSIISVTKNDWEELMVGDEVEVKYSKDEVRLR